MNKLAIAIPGSVAVSNETALTIGCFGVTDPPQETGELAAEISCLDAILHGIIATEKVYAISTNRIGIEQEPLISGHAELPIDVIPPWESPIADSDYPWDEITNLLSKDVNFKKLMATIDPDSDENANTIARITAGDLWRASVLQIPFLANHFESGICLAEQILGCYNVGGSVHPSMTAVSFFAEAWSKLVTDANILKGQRFFTSEMPFFLLSVLRESQSIEDIWKVAMQMRETKEAKSFRNWCTEITAESDVKKVIQDVTTIRQLAEDLFQATSIGTSAITLGVGFPPSLSVGLPTYGTLKAKWRARRPHFRFIRRIVRDAFKASRLEAELIRIMGVRKDSAIKAVALING